MTEEEHDHHRQLAQRAPCRTVGAMLDVHRERKQQHSDREHEVQKPQREDVIVHE